MIFSATGATSLKQIFTSLYTSRCWAPVSSKERVQATVPAKLVQYLLVRDSTRFPKAVKFFDRQVSLQNFSLPLATCIATNHSQMYVRDQSKAFRFEPTTSQLTSNHNPIRLPSGIHIRNINYLNEYCTCSLRNACSLKASEYP